MRAVKMFNGEHEENAFVLKVTRSKTQVPPLKTSPLTCVHHKNAKVVTSFYEYSQLFL